MPICRQEHPMTNIAHRRRPAPAHRLAKLAIAAGLAGAALTAFAHHGWNWAEDEQSRLSGTIESITIAPPHPMLRVRAGDGALWQVDLGNPRQTERSGFGEGSAKVGDRVEVLGNRTREAGKAHMKAVRITIDGRNFDMYPERIAD
jgi:hypothetical protein